MSGVLNVLLAVSSSPTFSGTVSPAFQTDSSSYYQYIYLSPSTGTLTPSNVISTGNIITSISTYYNDYFSPVLRDSSLTISGFSSNPGQSFITQIKVDSITYLLTPAAAVSYTYDPISGTALWIDTNNSWLNGPGPYAMSIP